MPDEIVNDLTPSPVEAPVVVTPASPAAPAPPASASEAAPNVAPAGTPAPSFLESLPEEYRSNVAVNEAAKSKDPTAALVKHLTNLEKTIAELPTIPKVDATPEEFAAWVAKVAPPDNSAYGDIKPVLAPGQENLAEIIDAGYTPERMGVLAEAARAAGIMPQQMKAALAIIQADEIASAQNMLVERQQQAEAQDAQFNELITKSFGVDKGRALDVGGQFLRDHLSEQFKPYLASLTNEALAVVTAVAFQAHKTYGTEDKLPTTGMSAGNIADKAASDTAINEAMANPDYSNRTAPNHQQAVDRVQELIQNHVKRGFGKQ